MERHLIHKLLFAWFILFNLGCQAKFNILNKNNADLSSRSPSGSDGTPASSLTISPSVLKIITGETATFSSSLGIPTYTYADGGSGYINASTGVYTVPLSASPFTETVRVTDSTSATSSATVSVRAFQTKDSFNLHSNPGPASGFATAMDANGNIYSVGDGNYQWKVRKSSNGGATWTDVDTYIATSGGYAYARGIVITPSGAIYVSGFAYNASVSSVWTVRKSTDGGATWTTVDNYQLVTNKNCFSYKMAADSAGNLFAMGECYDGLSTAILHWIVRKSSDAGTTWTTVENFQYSNGYHATGYDIKNLPSGLYGVGHANASGGKYLTIRRSVDAGSNWANVAVRLCSENCWGKGIAEDASGNLYVAYTINVSNIQTSKVIKSTDSGATWSEVDSFTYSPGYHADATELYIDQSNNIYLSGNGLDSSGSGHWFIRRSTNAGASWTTVDDFVEGTSKISYPTKITGNSSGHLFATGYGIDSANLKHWIVRKSTDGGTTWSNLQDYNKPIYLTAVANASATDSLGNLYVVGRAYNSNNANRWIVRKSSDGGATWNTVDLFSVDTSNNSNEAKAIVIDSQDNIYVMGNGLPSSPVSRLIVRKSTDRGATWVTVDSYNRITNGDTFATNMTIDSAGNIYTLAYGRDAAVKYHWVVRKSSDGGANWTILDDYQYGTSAGTSPQSLKVDSSGAIYVAGFAEEAQGVYTQHWLVRKSTDGGTTWNNVDDFNLDTSHTSSARQLIINSAGHIYVVGNGYDSANKGHLIVRKSTDSGASWSTVDDYVYVTNYDTNAYSMTLDASGSIFTAAVGLNYVNSSWVYTSIVRKSADGGAAWRTVDEYTYGRIQGIQNCFSDRVCVVGFTTEYLGDTHWFTRILSP